MSARFFEGSDHAQLYAKIRPTPPPVLVEKLLDYLREKYNGPMNLAVDLGCGPGQCTFTLAKHFETVLGTDISPAQIKEATELAKDFVNVRFEAAPAEAIPVADHSVQLVTICEAAHWMDLPSVFQEVKRVLAPNGVFAIIGYHRPIYSIKDKSSSHTNTAIGKFVEKFREKALKYFPPKALTVFTEYADLQLPFSDATRYNRPGADNLMTKARIFNMLIEVTQIPLTRPATLGSMEVLMRSYSAYQTLCRLEGDSTGEELLKQLRSGFHTETE